MKLNGIGLIVGYYTTAQDQRRMSEHATITPQEYLPAVITSIDEEQKTVNLHLLLDGPGTYHVKGITEGTEPGQFVADFENFFDEYDEVESFDLDAVTKTLTEEIEKRIMEQVPAMIEKAVKAATPKAPAKAKEPEPVPTPAATTPPAQ